MIRCSQNRVFQTSKSKKKKKKKSKAPAAAKTGPETEEDIDALLASYNTYDGRRFKFLSAYDITIQQTMFLQIGLFSRCRNSR